MLTRLFNCRNITLHVTLNPHISLYTSFTSNCAAFVFPSQSDTTAKKVSALSPTRDQKDWRTLTMPLLHLFKSWQVTMPSKKTPWNIFQHFVRCVWLLTLHQLYGLGRWTRANFTTFASLFVVHRKYDLNASHSGLKPLFHPKMLPSPFHEWQRGICLSCEQNRAGLNIFS